MPHLFSFDCCDLPSQKVHELVLHEGLLRALFLHAGFNRICFTACRSRCLITHLSASIVAKTSTQKVHELVFGEGLSRALFRVLVQMLAQSPPAAAARVSALLVRCCKTEQNVHELVLCQSLIRALVCCLGFCRMLVSQDYHPE